MQQSVGYTHVPDPHLYRIIENIQEADSARPYKRLNDCTNFEENLYTDRQSVQLMKKWVDLLMLAGTTVQYRNIFLNQLYCAGKP